MKPHQHFDHNLAKAKFTDHYLDCNDDALHTVLYRLQTSLYRQCQTPDIESKETTKNDYSDDDGVDAGNDKDDYCLLCMCIQSIGKNYNKANEREGQ